MVQLGYYPGEGAKYEPHLDRWPSETTIDELTVLVYANVGWDADLMGGQLRLHPNGGSVDSTCSAFGFRSTAVPVLSCRTRQRRSVLWTCPRCLVESSSSSPANRCTRCANRRLAITA